MSEESNLLPIRQAAAKVHKSRQYVRGLVDAGHVIAYRDGGTDAAPWLSVDWREVEAWIKAHRVYVPPALAKRQKRAGKPARGRRGDLHPAAAAM